MSRPVGTGADEPMDLTADSPLFERKRRRILDSTEEEADEQDDVSQTSRSPVPPTATIGDDSDVEVVEEESGFVSPAATVLPNPSAALMAAMEEDDDDVHIITSRNSNESRSSSRASTPSGLTTAAPQRKRQRVSPIVSALSGAALPPTPSSPTAPMLSPVTRSTSGVDDDYALKRRRFDPFTGMPAPAMQRQDSVPDPADSRDLDREEREAVMRVRRERLLRQRQVNDPNVELSSASNGISTTASPVPPAAATGGIIRRRKAPTTSSISAASTLASASLLHSYSGISTAGGNSIDPTLLWHLENQVVLPANAADKIDVERTFLQQVLVWDPWAPSGKKGSGTSAIPNLELAAFQKFLDPKVPLPVHFTTPLAYLGYFAPVILEEFKSQLLSTVEEGSVKVQPQTQSATSRPKQPTLSYSTFSERNRSCWSVLSLQPCSTVGGGGEDWFELRLKLIALQHPGGGNSRGMIAAMSGADILVLGLDAEPPPPAQHNDALSAALSSSPSFPAPTSSTVYVFAFLERVEQGGEAAKVRIYLPGVGSAMSSYVAPASNSSAAGASSATSSSSRFQLFYNRLQQAAQSVSRPVEEGGKNANANFTPLGARVSSTADGSSKILPPPVYPLYLSRCTTLITTLREYTALVKIVCLNPLRIQGELLRPSLSQESDHSDPIDLAGEEPSGNAATNEPDEEQPPALESMEQVVKEKVKKAKQSALRQSGAPPDDSLAHLDSPAWMVLPSGFRDFLQHTLNPRQLKAVQVAMKRYQRPGFTLLQGPPGTGKSKTVVALLNSLHLGAFQRHYDSLIAHCVDGAPILPKPRILVCAPSNTAVDELITRVTESGISKHPPQQAAEGAPAKVSTTVEQSIYATLKGHGGFVDGQRTRYSPSVVRLGNSDSIRPELKNLISLDALVDGYHRMGEEDLKQRLVDATAYIVRMETYIREACLVYTKSKRLFFDMQATMDALGALGHDVQQQPQYRDYLRLRTDYLSRQSDVAHGCEKRMQAVLDYERCELALRFKVGQRTPGIQGRKERDAAMDGLRISFLNGVQLVFCTLSGSGLELLSRLDQPFSALIIDEAAQSTEVSTLIPLTHDVRHVILVGDPRQLPATVFSHDSSAKRMWERSLFERLEQAGHQMHALTTQYRMHSEIREFPSKYFYSNLLRDSTLIQQKDGPYHKAYHAREDFRPIVFFDLQSEMTRGGGANAGGAGGSGEDPASRSVGNVKEAAFVVDLIGALFQQFPPSMTGSRR